MPRSLPPNKKHVSRSFKQLRSPLALILPSIPPLESRCNRPLQMNFGDQLNALIFFHLEEHTSGRHLIQVLQEDDYARNNIAPAKGIQKSSFFEVMHDHGLEQFMFVFQELQKQASALLPQKFLELGQLVAIDGSLIDSILSMHWADYRKGAKKAKAHIGFDINSSIPRKIFLTDGISGERPFAGQIIEPGQTGIMDRGYQCHQNFDRHLRVYHLISRSPHGLMIQILSGLITYLLLAIHCHEQHGEKVSIKRVRELRNKIHNETRRAEAENLCPDNNSISHTQNLYASP